jgi:hypothetical protein
MTIAKAPLESRSLDYLNDTPAPGKQLKEQHDHREHDQGVNEAAADAEAKAESPQDEQNDHYGPQHKSSTSFSRSAYRVETSSVHPLILSMNKEQTINRVDASLDVTIRFGPHVENDPVGKQAIEAAPRDAHAFFNAGARELSTVEWQKAHEVPIEWLPSSWVNESVTDAELESTRTFVDRRPALWRMFMRREPTNTRNRLELQSGEARRR